jgi:hypothetical protein
MMEFLSPVAGMFVLTGISEVRIEKPTFLLISTVKGNGIAVWEFPVKTAHSHTSRSSGSFGYGIPG